MSDKRGEERWMEWKVERKGETGRSRRGPGSHRREEMEAL